MGLENASKSQGIQEFASRLAQKSAQIAPADEDSKQELSVGLGQFNIQSLWWRESHCGVLQAIQSSPSLVVCTKYQEGRPENAMRRPVSFETKVYAAMREATALP